MIKKKGNVKEDHQLVQRVKNGDQKAFKILFEQNIVPLYRFMKQFSPDKDQVDEWVQRAFIKSYENIDKFDGISLYRTWLFKIALNEMRTDYRKIGRIMHDLEEAENYYAEIEDLDFEWQLVMKNWLFELDEVKRAVFILYEVEGYSHSEIALMLKISEVNSRAILARTKNFLREKWLIKEKAR
jgi:RNA polymerase sigma-70 factor (ECF subfamily)